MKYLLLALFLISFFQFSTKADDIREFELEGMSVGESLLIFKDKKFIQNRLNDSNTFFYKNKTFAVIGLDILSDLFEGISATIKPKDKNSIIYAIEGRLFFPNDMKKCRTKMDEISNDISSIFPDVKPTLLNSVKHGYDKTGNTFFDAYLFELSNGHLEIFCIDWSNEITKKENFTDELKLIINSQELRNWINKEAFN